MQLWDAPFHVPLRVARIRELDSDTCLVLTQLGLDPQELVEKVHVAPLGDPVMIRIGSQLFTLRREICEKIDVEAIV